MTSTGPASSGTACGTSNVLLHEGQARRWPQSWTGALMRALQAGQSKVNEEVIGAISMGRSRPWREQCTYLPQTTNDRAKYLGSHFFFIPSRLRVICSIRSCGPCRAVDIGKL